MFSITRGRLYTCNNRTRICLTNWTYYFVFSLLEEDLTAATARLDSLRKTNHAKLPESGVASFGKSLVFRHLGRLVTDKAHLQ